MYYGCNIQKCTCNYDVCRICALSMGDKPLLEKGVMGTSFPEIHKCRLKPHKMDAPERKNFECDIANVCPDDPVCESHLQKTYRSEYVYGLECRKCDFDICIACVIKRQNKGKSLQPESYIKAQKEKLRPQ